MINAVLFGAMAGAGVAAAVARRVRGRDPARGQGRRGAACKGFALGYAHATGEASRALARPSSRRGATNPVERVRSAFPGETHRILEEGVARTTDYQDAAYATLYLDRLEPIAKLDRDGGGGAHAASSSRTRPARFLALWMCYEDVIRVADLKSRRSRFERVRERGAGEAGRAGAHRRVPEARRRGSRRGAAAAGSRGG